MTTSNPARNSASFFLQPHRQPSTTSRESSHVSNVTTAASHVAATPFLGANATSGFPTSSPRSSMRRSSRPHLYVPPSPTIPSSSTMASASAPQTRPQPQHPDTQATDAQERMWAEMQQKLEEVELSTAYVFGPSHAKSLEELRAAQRGLAQAWMRSEEDALDGEHAEFGKMAFAAGGAGMASGKGEGLVGGENAQVTGSLRGRAARAEQGTENDILLARKRRQANDAHFKRVAESVMDVTKKLESVAKAMAGVERESRGIWDGSNENESDASSVR
ncbi:hypothetical protein RUND412_003074 [Rhizina undulata]